MGTLLVTPKMNPALAARVRNSLNGPLATRALNTPRARAPWQKSVLRISLLLFATGTSYFIYHSIQSQRAALEAGQQRLLSKVQQARSKLTESESRKLQTVHDWTAKLRDDQLLATRDVALTTKDGVNAQLTRPTLYVRGPWLGGFGTAAELMHSAAESRKDAFLYCWMAPLALTEQTGKRSENELVKHVDHVNRATQEMLEATASVSRLEDAVIGLKFVDQGWSEPIRRLPSVEQVELLERAWENAQVERKLQATRAEVLLAVFDEPKEAGSPVELDGASRHKVRVAWVDLEQGKLLYYAVRPSDPDWISESRRVRLASAIESCRIATELRAELNVAPDSKVAADKAPAEVVTAKASSARKTRPKSGTQR